MTKTDFKTDLRELFAPPSKDFVLVRVPEINFLMVEGRGDPNTARRYTDAVEALYSVAYPLKFASRQELARDCVVPLLRGCGGLTIRVPSRGGPRNSGVGR